MQLIPTANIINTFPLGLGFPVVICVTLLIILLYNLTIYLKSMFIYIDKRAKPHVIKTPPIGCLRFDFASLEISPSRSSMEFSGLIIVKLINTTDKIISYILTSNGHINGISFNDEKVKYIGYAYPNQPFYLMSKIIKGLPLVAVSKEDIMIFNGVYKYEMQYCYVGVEIFERKTARVVEIDIQDSLIDKAVMTISNRNINVTTSNSIEE